jgi:hypothetical protein
VDDLAHARALRDQLGETFCLTYLKGVDPTAALRRLGGCPDTIRARTAGEPAGQSPTAVALDLGTWSVVIEPGGMLGAGHALLEAASRGTAAVSVLRHDAGAAHFGYAVDGTTITAFDPGYPAEETSWGEDPRLLRPLMDALGLRPPSDEGESGWQDAEARAIVLAQRITGVRLPEQPLSAARVSAELEPWFVVPAGGADLLRAGRRHPYAAELVAAAEAASPQVQRVVAVAEIRRQAAVLGIADSPGLTRALTAGGPVAPDSPLGRQVRAWLAPGRPSGLPWFLAALRGVLDPDPRVALLAALKPYTSDLPGLADDRARAAVLSSLRHQGR